MLSYRVTLLHEMSNSFVPLLVLLGKQFPSNMIVLTVLYTPQGTMLSVTSRHTM